MNKTRMEDMLLEMISPKVKEIEEKFSRGEGLTQDDINTLLLKSQYNHINHLDQKLDEVTQSVISLEARFNELENKFESLKTYVDQRFEIFEKRFEIFEQRFETFEQKVESTIQKALNKNMMTLIIVIGAFMTLSKIIDKF